MKTRAFLLVGVAALFLATGAAHAAEWQCGPHYVSTFGLHGWPGEEKARQCRDYHILAYPAYNQTREQAGEKSDIKALVHGLEPWEQIAMRMNISMAAAGNCRTARGKAK